MTGPAWSTKSLLLSALSLLSVLPTADAWLMEFWSSQVSCKAQQNKKGGNVAADTSRSGRDLQSNNCMMLSHDPKSPTGIQVMKVTGWSDDCVIALWSDQTGLTPCWGSMPWNGEGKAPDQVFEKNRLVMSGVEDNENPYQCIDRLDTYMRSGSGYVGYAAYSCGANATLLREEKKKDLNRQGMSALLSILESSSTDTASASVSVSGTIAATLTASGSMTIATASASTAPSAYSPRLTSLPDGVDPIGDENEGDRLLSGTDTGTKSSATKITTGSSSTTSSAASASNTSSADREEKDYVEGPANYYLPTGTGTSPARAVLTAAQPTALWHAFGPKLSGRAPPKPTKFSTRLCA
ncbi:hypothetical protein PG994_004895 [Apiospora phragmitis]|uniref:C-type lectin domain-containing protein n=1 Tax=Apiospora phragmitis TaxID=2905665 RepID=A0ABR1VRV6_9PEZI